MCLRCLYVNKDKQSDERGTLLLNSRNIIKSVEAYGNIKQGSGPKCQDTFTIMPNFIQNTHFFAVYDGAGPQGHEIANRAEQKMREYIERGHKRLVSFKKDEDYRRFLQEGFKAMQDDLEASRLDYQYTKSGTCCVCVLIAGNMAFMANVGNSRAVLCTTRGEGTKTAVDISSDHTLESLRERERCLRAGAKIGKDTPSGKLKAQGPERIWYNDEGPGITSTRMLGYNKFGIIAEPEIVSFEVRGQDKFFVLASDGIWDVLGSKDVVDFINRSDERKNTSEDIVNRAKKIWENEYGDHELRFVGDDVNRRAADDVSVVIVYLNYSK